jgi:hypothetical protein
MLHLAGHDADGAGDVAITRIDNTTKVSGDQLKEHTAIAWRQVARGIHDSNELEISQPKRPHRAIEPCTEGCAVLANQPISSKSRPHPTCE